MNILSAIYAGQTGFLKVTESIAKRANRIAQSSFTPSEEGAAGAGDAQVAEDIVGMQLDKTLAKANASTIKVADSLMSEFVKDTLKK